jgi:hypothetical protein
VTSYNKWLANNNVALSTKSKGMSMTARGNDYLSRIEEVSNQKIRLAPITEMRVKFSQTALDKMKAESVQRDISNDETVAELTL